MFATVLLLLSVVVLLLGVFGLGTIGILQTIPLGLALLAGGLLFGRLNL